MVDQITLDKVTDAYSALIADRGLSAATDLLDKGIFWSKTVGLLTETERQSMLMRMIRTFVEADCEQLAFDALTGAVSETIAKATN